MLILTRKLGESITIGDGSITVSVMEIKGRQVRLGIDAPANTPIHREEVFVKIKESNEQAVKTDLNDLDNMDFLLSPKGDK